jgi:hypothetical protein
MIGFVAAEEFAILETNASSAQRRDDALPSIPTRCRGSLATAASTSPGNEIA